MPLPRYDITVDPGNYKADLTRIIEKIKPTVNPQSLKFKVYDGGLTNKLIGCYESTSTDIILCRVYGLGTESFLNRDDEVNTMSLLHECGIGSKVYCRFNNGICYEYINGQIVDAELLQNESVYTQVATLMARIHLLNVNTKTYEICSDSSNSSKENLVIFDKLNELFKLLPSEFNTDTLKSTKENIQKLPSREKLENEIDFLVDYLVNYGKANNSKIVFSHNDILLGNVIYDKEKDRVSFIDYEYSGYNYQGFDIGNHFNEYAGTDNINYNLFPTKEYQLKWLKVYLNVFYADNLSLVTDVFIEKFYNEVNKFGLLSHVFWGVWAIVQAKNMESDFDYVVFALCHLNEYFKRKDECIGL